MYYSTKRKVAKLERRINRIRLVRCLKKVIVVGVCSFIAVSTATIAAPSDSTSVHMNSNNEDNEETDSAKGESYICALPVAGVSRYQAEALLAGNRNETLETNLITKVEEEVVENKPEENLEIIEKPIRENVLYQVVDETGWVSTLDAKYQDYLWEMCKKYGIEDYYTLLLAQMYHESGFDIKSISQTNDYGLMQINICNHERLSKELGSNDFLDPYISIEAGVLMMSDFLYKYDTVQKALVCYNKGESAVLVNGIYSTEYSRCVVKDIGLLVEIQE